eukprot:10902840-Lingulodinium_polyedra.AAC.1
MVQLGAARAQGLCPGPPAGRLQPGRAGSEGARSKGHCGQKAPGLRRQRYPLGRKAPSMGLR